MRYHRKIGLILMLVLLVGLAPEAQAQFTGNCEPALGEAMLDINNVRARILNNGNLFWRGDPFIYEVPKGGGANAIFTSGIWIGGFVGGQLRVAATRYNNYQFWGGPLDDNGNPPADCAIFDRLYKVSRGDIEEYEATGVSAPDLRDWPTGLGAPTLAPRDNGVDDDGDGEVDEEGEQIQVLDQPLAQRIDRTINLAGGERPAILGDQSIWWIMNDRGNEHLAPGADTPPVGLEVHAMAFAFNTSGDIGNTTFYKYDIYYKGAEPLTEAYIGLFSDPDLGNFDDDWVGSDTTRGMGFVWNSDNEDEGGDGYGTPAPAAGYDFFQGPIVPSVGDTAYVSGVARPDFRNLKMTHFVYYNNTGSVIGDPTVGTDYYNYMDGRWRDGKRITLGGNGRDFSETPVDFMFTGDAATCSFWSECDSDGQGNAIAPADRRFVMSSGPFTINPGDFQQVVFGIVWARGADNFDSVTKLQQADALAQAAFDVNFELPAPPAAPEVTATALDGQVVLEWTNSPRSNNYLESYVAEDPFAPDDNKEYHFEGYDVFQFDNALDQIGRLIATYDVANGVTRVIDGIPGEPTTITASGNDGGARTFHNVGGLTNYTTYYFGVQAYAYNDASTPKVYRGPMTRVEAVPTRTIDVLSDAALEAAQDTREPDLVATKVGIGDGSVTANVVNPGIIQDATYTVEFYEIQTGKRSLVAALDEGQILDPRRGNSAAKSASADETVVTYDIKRDGTVIFDGSATGAAAPQRANVVLVEGLQFSVQGPEPGFKDFQTVQNAAGVLDPPDYAAYSFNSSGFPDPAGHVAPERGRQQSTNNSRWGFHAGAADIAFGPATTDGTFLARATRNGSNLPAIGPIDYEMRFTQACLDAMNGVVEAGDCLGESAFAGNNYFMEVPFEIWQIGIGTPDDTSDDYRLVPIVCDTATCGGGSVEGVYDIGGDHDISGGADDPFTDYVYWYRPEDTTPGQAGYESYFFGPGDVTDEIMARTVLVVHNGGTAPPYDPAMPEPGTIFRIVTDKPNQPGDVYTLSTSGLGAQTPDQTTRQARLDDIGIVPNPYKGASNYEVSQLVDQVRFTNLPDVATIRVFTLNGTLIRTLEKQSPGVATLSWNLTTDNNLPIASGVYLIHVDVPDVGERVLKFAVIKKRIQLNTF